jgi:hypothetical protein
MRPYGQIICFNNLNPYFFSKGQRFFTRMPYTHVAMMFPDVLGVESYFGADETADLKPTSRFLNDEKMLYQMYMPQGWTDEQIRIALTKIYNRYAGETYGYMQIAWFMVRGVMEGWPFYKDVRRWHNFFPKHPICSEIAWWYLWFLYEARPELTQLRDKLNEWRPDTFHAGDSHTVVMSFPDLFKFTEERWSDPK